MRDTSEVTRRKQAILALILANIIWGAASPIFKWSLTNIEPFTLAFLRFSLATLLILPFATHSLKINKEDWPKLIILSLLGITVNISFFFLGLKLAPSINAPIIATAGPVLLLAGCLIILKERLKRRILLGTLIGLLGVLTIIFRPLVENGFDHAVLGNLFFVLATIGSVGNIIMTKRIIQKYEAVTITFWSFLIGSITFIPFLIYETSQFGFLTNLALPGFVGILFGTILSSAVAYFLYDWSIKNLQAQEVGVFAYLDPIVAILIAIPLLGELPTLTYLLGALFVFLGIFVAQGRIPYHPLNQLKNLKV